MPGAYTRAFSRTSGRSAAHESENIPDAASFPSLVSCEAEARLRRVIPPRAAVALLALVAVLAGCTATPTPDPEPTSTEAARLEACFDAATGIVTAAGDLVAEYESPSLDPAATPTPGATPATEAPQTSGDAIAEAVASARATRDSLGCDPETFTTDLENGLARIEPEAPIAAAVWRRVSASVLGTVEQEPRVWELTADDDLADVLARAADGTTIVLPAGDVEVDATIVLLAGVTLRGAGRSETVLRSTAPDAAVLVVTDGLVRLETLTLQLASGRPSSGIVAGPSASLALDQVRITGATSEGAGDSAGGAGVYLSAQGLEGSGRGTTLEITGSVLDANAWAGLAVTGGHRVSIESSTFRDNGGAGIVFLDATSGSIAKSTFDDNAVGVAAAGTATPAIIASTFTGGTVGVQADASAAPTIDRNTITGAQSAAVIFGGKSGGSIEGTKCRDVSHGIVIGDAAAPTLGENDCGIARGSG